MDLPLDADRFISELQNEMREALGTLDAGLKKNPALRITPKGGGWITLTPLDKQPDPPNLAAFKAELNAIWPMTSLLDMVKETDLRLGFTDVLKSPTAYETLERSVLQPRLLLCLHGIGTNAGLQRMAGLESGVTAKDMAYVRRRYVSIDPLRRAIAIATNGTLQARNPAIWGSATTACASDSKHHGAWDQNLTTQWHERYGGRRIMIYWHVERNSLCIHSQLKSPSSSEVASMIEGVIHHCTEMEVDRQYVDSHGQSTVAFAFCRLLGFQLLPRLKAIHSQTLYRPEASQAGAYANLQLILGKPIDWELVRQQYDQMIKYTTALRLGTAETEAILRRFTKNKYRSRAPPSLDRFEMRVIWLSQEVVNATSVAVSRLTYERNMTSNTSTQTAPSPTRMETVEKIVTVGGRALVALLFILAGVVKILTPKPFLEHMVQFGIPTFLLPAVIALELGAGIAILIGWRIRYTAGVLAIFCVLTAAIFHYQLSINSERTSFFKDLAIAGGLFVMAAGASVRARAK